MSNTPDDQQQTNAQDNWYRVEEDNLATQTTSEPAEPDVFTVEPGTKCFQCGYDLGGLPSNGTCPECGYPIEKSLRGDDLAYSSPSYLRSLHRGALFTQASIIVHILLSFLAMGIGVAAVSLSGQGATVAVQLALTGLGLVVSGLGLYGMWIFTAQDPSYTGKENPAGARTVTRIAVAVQAATALLAVPLEVIMTSGTGSGGTGATGAAMGIVMIFSMVVGLASTAAWVTQFFASMLYIRWLAPRIPNAKAFKRAKTLMWLGPVLMTVGIFLIGLGPLIALVLYYNLFSWLRVDLKRMRETVALEEDIQPHT